MPGVGTSFVLAACLAAATMLTPSARAQTNYLLNEPGTWKPWKFTAVASARKDRVVTPAELKAFEAELLALQAIARSASGVATPRGFSVETWGSLFGYNAPAPGQPAGRDLPLAGTFDFGAFPIFEYQRNGKPVRSDTGETPLLILAINYIDPSEIGAGRPSEWGALSTDAMLQPAAAGDVAGFPRFGDILVIKKNPASLWASVPFEQSLQLLGAAQRNTLTEVSESVEKFQSDLKKVQDPAVRAARQADRKRSAAMLPDGGAFLKQMEAADAAELASLQSELSPTSGSMKLFLEAERAMADTTAWLTSLSPAERTAPACYNKTGASLRTRFPSGQAAGCVPITRPNWAFFNRTLPRSAPQVVVIGSIARCFDRQPAATNPAGCPANRQLLNTLDKQALLNWLH